MLCNHGNDFQNFFYFFYFFLFLWSCCKIEISGDFTTIISNLLICGVNGRSRMFNNVLIRFLDPKNIRLDLDTKIMILH